MPSVERALKLFGFACLTFVSAFGCRREERRFSEEPSANRLSADPALATTSDRENLIRYSEDAWAIAEGQRLFAQMNCQGCHGHGGGGGMGLPLSDSKWRYGNDVQEIERSIVFGRPNGMPAFATRLSPQQIWQLVAYVRTLSAQAPSQAMPSRDDHMAVRPPPSRSEPEPPLRQKVD